MIEPEWFNSYAAGFFDGEGCISITKLLVLRCDLRGCFNPNLLESFLRKWKGSIQKVKNLNLKYKNQINWAISGEDAFNFLIDIYPYCWEKKDQIRLGIKFQYLRRKFKYEKLTCDKKSYFHEIFNIMKELKKINHDYQHINPQKMCISHEWSITNE